MKVAVSYKDGEIYEHFGHAEHFAIYEFEGMDVETGTKRLIDVSHEIICMWVQAAVYFGTTLLVYRNNIAASRRRMEEKKEDIRKRMEQRRATVQEGEEA